MKRVLNFKSIVLLAGLVLSTESIAAPFEFSVVAFNTWGVPFAVKDTYRYAQAMDAIEFMNPDFVFLEEVFSRKGRRDFHSSLYPFEVNGPRALPRLVSGGVRLLSKYPIVSSAKMAFWDCVKDDCLSKKGALLAVVRLPNQKKLNLVLTHLNARGGDAVRNAQIDQLKFFLDEFADKASPVLMVGDFNFNPESASYPHALKTLQVQDTWAETHFLGEPGFTYDTTHNEYARDYALKHGFPLVEERIDFLFVRSAGNLQLKPISSDLIFNQSPLLSDHYGLKASFRLESTALADQL